MTNTNASTNNNGNEEAQHRPSAEMYLGLNNSSSMIQLEEGSDPAKNNEDRFSVIDHLKNDVWAVLHGHPLVGIFFTQKKGDNYTRTKRILGLIAFLCVQIAVLALLNNDKSLAHAAQCHCIHLGADDGSCSTEGESLFDLPSHGQYKEEWTPHLRLLPSRLLRATEFCDDHQDDDYLGDSLYSGKEYCTGPIQYCCYAHTMSKISTKFGSLEAAIRQGKDLPRFTVESPCGSSIKSILLSSILATLISYGLLDPLVQWLFRKEINPLAYFLLLLQICVGLYAAMELITRAQNFGISEGDAALSMIGSICLSLCVTSVCIGFALRIVV